jgi:hypothetical protein
MPVIGKTVHAGDVLIELAAPAERLHFKEERAPPCRHHDPFLETQSLLQIAEVADALQLLRTREGAKASPCSMCPW